MDIWEIIGSLCTLLGGSGIISSLVIRRIDKLERALEARESDLVEENVMRGEVLHTSARLTEANTYAIRAVTSDEVCERELNEHRGAMDRLEHFMRKKSAEYLHAN